MAVVEKGGITGSVSNLFGPKTFRWRRGQNTITQKPHPLVLKGVKNMSDEELAKLAEKTGYDLDDLKKIREKQQNMDDALEFCRKEKKQGNLSDPKYAPIKPGETRFNRCVGLYLEGKVGR